MSSKLGLGEHPWFLCSHMGSDLCVVSEVLLFLEVGVTAVFEPWKLLGIMRELWKQTWKSWQLDVSINLENSYSYLGVFSLEGDETG